MRPVNVIKILAFFIVLASSGCAGTSQTARFYILSPIPAAERTAPIDVLVTVSMVDLADYLDRPQIVTRTSANEISFSEFERWAEPLNEAIPRLVAENLSLLLGSPKIATVPWQGSVAPDYTVFFEVIRFDGSPGGEVVLHSLYAIMDKEEEVVFKAKRSIHREPAGGPGYEAMVSAGSRAVAAMSREIAEAIRSIHAK